VHQLIAERSEPVQIRRVRNQRGQYHMREAAVAGNLDSAVVMRILHLIRQVKAGVPATDYDAQLWLERHGLIAFARPGDRKRLDLTERGWAAVYAVSDASCNQRRDGRRWEQITLP
jgi:hypothetical protein